LQRTERKKEKEKRESKKEKERGALDGHCCRMERSVS
jgi:hypothetical protein